MNHILIIGFVWPEPNSSAAGSRMMQLIALFTAQNWKITFASPAAETEHMISLENINISKAAIELNSSSFDDFITEQQPDIVIFDRFITEEQFGWRVTKHCPNALKILNTEDLHSLRKTRQESFKSDTTFSNDDLLHNDITKREIASIYRCDLSLIISDFEIKLLKETFKIDKNLLFYLPFLFKPITAETKKRWPEYKNRKHFVTIGNFRHEPNWNSILYLKKIIWPLIRKELPETELHIYGAYPPPKATQLHNPKEGFYIKGWTKNAKEIMSQARICLAPLRFGAGIKGKLAEAMLCGTPSITTTIGAEGMLDEESDWSGFVIDDPSKFAKAAVRLYNNESLWQQSQQNGIEIINTRFQEKIFCNSFLNQVSKLQKNLNKHRTENFIGNLLQHHTLRSTEFMSRWIEEKNRSK
ncbi:glycosyltransferase involved in cell wall biosynthesis [Aquimarina sp. MAR_2010_214]|uniref:glycosyltransferase family 4 protein n=1 Tax=Aquimarina sp. MAR_2010_214 TaxID=1250026 RepID=UPI000C712D0A|nr:glycosyltransferase family 4 protein [Aquimarina sp. MAR_2010_214]PKV52518.1 glycosyltransferase involved in cell wall biosynthesis [Aquimarina sp. MAR_2010_214]